MKINLELTAIQIMSGLLRSMMIQRNLPPIFRTRPTQILSMIYPNIPALNDQIQIYLFDSPGFLNPKKITIKFNISLGSNPPWNHFNPKHYPLKSPMNHLKKDL